VFSEHRRQTYPSPIPLASRPRPPVSIVRLSRFGHGDGVFTSP